MSGNNEIRVSLKTKMDECAKSFKNNGFNDLESGFEAKKLLFLYSLYHYYYGDDDRMLEVLDNCKYTTSFSDKAHAVFEPDSYDEKITDVLSAYFVEENEVFNMNNVLADISSIQTQIIQVKQNKYFQFPDGVIKEHADSLDDSQIVVRVVTNYIPGYDERKRMLEMLERQIPMFSYIKFEISFGDDILDEIVQLTSDKQCVEIGELSLDKENNALHYGNEDSIIVNVSALSLKDNYIKYGKAGLFSMNLRFYIQNKKVDSGIEDSIRNRGYNFWYYNNGIIIVCDDYEIVDKKIRLSNFSIVNGGQTTRMIGVVPFSEDFFISCKIIKNNYESLEQKVKFVSEVAEASNTQKPINSTDIIANRVEQRMIKQNLADAGVFVQIKRGDAASKNKENYPEPWQSTTNAELGQIIYASVYQHPGTARNSKDKIFSDKKKYDSVFGNYSLNKYSNELLKDLLIIRSHYKNWAKKISKANPSEADAIKKGLVKNGAFYFEAAILLMAKFYFGDRLIQEIRTTGISSDRSKALMQSRTFNHKILMDDYEAIGNRMTDLFNFVYDRYIAKAFNVLRISSPEMSYSNFTKTDKNYESFVIDNIFDDFADGDANRARNLSAQIFYIKGTEDEDLDDQMIDEAIDRIDNAPVEVDDEEVNVVDENLRELLTDYRSSEYKARGIKAYQVFTNKELDNIIRTKPRTLKELGDFGCFASKPYTKKRYYGERIVNIVKTVCGERNTD